MEILDLNTSLLRITVVGAIAAAISMIVVPLLDQPAVADQSAAAPTIVPQQPALDGAVQDFADRMALDQRIRRLEQQIQTPSNTAPTTVPQQPPIADQPQDLADRMALDQRLQRLEQQIQTLLNMQLETLVKTRERAVQTRTETFPKAWVRPKQTYTTDRHRRRHEIVGTHLAAETLDANPEAGQGITKAFGCPASVPCVERGTAPFTAPTATREYDEAGNEVKGITSEQDRGAGPPAPAPPTHVGRVITRQGANIRDVPTGPTVLRTVPRGTSLDAFARRDGWVQVGEEVPTGWIYSTLVKDAP
jgi:hypothetical protein